LIPAAFPQLAKPTDIKAHLEGLEHFYKIRKILDNETKVSLLFNSILEEMRFEIFCQLDFEANKSNYEWIKNKLIEVFHRKESEITPLVRLYSIKQKSHQTLREFLSEVRIEGYKLMKDVNPIERETKLLDVFTKGLRNKEVRAALNAHKVNSLDDAYKLIKKEKCSDSEYYARQINDEEQDKRDTMSELQDVKNEITNMKKQLQSIVTILQGLKSLQPTRPTYADAVRKQGTMQARKQFQVPDPNQNSFRQTNGQRKSVIQCWTCGMNGHISRFCEMNRNNNPMCRNCGRRGHISRNCRIRRNDYQNVRQIQWDSDEEYPHIDDTQYPSAPATMEEEDDTNHIERVNVLTVAEPQRPKAGNRNHKNKRMKQWPSYPQQILDLEEYIQGRRAKRNIRFEETQTLITNGRFERARNKPIIKGLCHGRPSKIFLDTGAEINVIDRSFVRQLAEQNFVRIHRASKVIRCANNSRLNVDGWVRLSITIGGQQKECKFWVIDNLFPKIILGIRAMKDYNITIDPGKNCMWIGNRNVPFISHIETQSLGKQQAGNGRVPGL